MPLGWVMVRITPSGRPMRYAKMVEMPVMTSVSHVPFKRSLPYLAQNTVMVSSMVFHLLSGDVWLGTNIAQGLGGLVGVIRQQQKHGSEGLSVDGACVGT